MNLHPIVTNNLRPFQIEGIEAIYKYYETNDGNAVLCYPTGTGKGFLNAGIIIDVMHRFPNQRLLMLTHVKNLIEQNLDKLLRLWPQAPVGVYSAGLNQRDVAQPLIFGGVASVVNNVEAFGHRDIILIDEGHLVSPDDNTMYRQIITGLKAINPYLKVITFTATPYRIGQGMITDGDGALFTDIIYDVTGVHAFNRFIAEGYLCPLIPKRTNIEIDTSNIKIMNGDFAKTQLDEATEKVIFKALQETVQYGYDRNCWLVFCSGIKPSEHAAEILQSMGISAVAIHSKLTDTQCDERFEAFKRGEIRAIVGNNKFTTGFDFLPVDLIVMLRSTMSPGLWCLDEETEVLTMEGWKNYNTINIGEEVPSFDLNFQTGMKCKITNKIKRDLYENEYFIHIQSQNTDIKVTNKHDLLISERKGRSRTFSKFTKINAESVLTNCNRNTKIPSSVLNIGLGLKDLTNSEVSFIGLFLADGTLDKSNNQITIYQSSRYPEIQNFIKETIINCNFKLREYTKNGDICFGKQRINSISRYQIAKNKSSENHSGWIKLEPYIDKNLSLSLFNLSTDQFKVLLNAINLGDGQKNNFGEYKRKTYQISTGNKIFAERFAALGTINGYSCKVVKRSYDNVYMIHLKEQSERTIKPEHFSKVREDNKKVWCVETQTGTIIIKRNGKISIVGNCQMLGRGTRPYDYDNIEQRIEGFNYKKSNCLVLDFAGNTKRLGPINDVIIPKKKGDKIGEAPIRICEAVIDGVTCGVYNHCSAKVCCACGTEFPVNVKILRTAGTDELIKSDMPTIETFEVNRVIYHRHSKVGSEPSIKVTYYTGLLDKFSEYVCLQHKGYAKTRAKQWWMARHASDPPETTDEALAYVSQLRVPKRIRVRVDLKYPEILGVEW